MKSFNKFLAVAMFALIVPAGCQGDPVEEEKRVYREVNGEIVDNFRFYYLWEKELPVQIEIPDTDPFLFFDNLRRSDDIEHHWSVLSNNRESFYAGIANKGKSFGYSLGIMKFTNPEHPFYNQIWAVVRYVHPGTPADRAGIERGDLISHIGGELITDGGPNDYRNLVNANSLVITLHKHIEDDGREVSLTAASGYLDPILDYKVITRGANRIAYLMYTDYVQASEDDLAERFAYFKAEGVTDLILDLRYNGGGTVSTSKKMASLIGPASMLDGENIFSKFKFNDPYEALMAKEGILEEQTLELYPTLEDMPENLNLNRVYVLTSGSSASASEQTIIGLMPFMTIVQIGTSTHGKFTGGFVLPQSDEPKWHGWGMYLITFRYTNFMDYPDKNEGLVPDYEVAENWQSYKPIGAEDDPLIAQAISLITGEPIPVSASAASVDAAPYGNAEEIWGSHPGMEKGMLIDNH